MILNRIKTGVLASLFAASMIMTACATSSSPSSSQVSAISQAMSKISASAAQNLSHVSTVDARDCYTKSLTMQLILNATDKSSSTTQFGGRFLTQTWKAVVDSRPESENEAARAILKQRSEERKANLEGLTGEQKVAALTDGMESCAKQVAEAIEKVDPETIRETTP